MSFTYANPGSGPSAGGIGWFNFGNLSMNPGDSLTGLTGTLNDGTKITFDLSMANTSGIPKTFVSTTVPVFNIMPFGSIAYTGIMGNATLYSDFGISGNGVNTFTISNIIVLDPLGNPVSGYTFVFADTESTNIDEGFKVITNGQNWKLLTTIGSNPPILNGIGTNTATISGTTLFPQISAADYVLTSDTPSQITIDVTESLSGRQGFAIGFATTQVKLQKYIGQRINTTDQFLLNIAGTPNNNTTTTGIANGLQVNKASIYAADGNSYTINEAMAAGSGSLLTDYIKSTSAMNTTAGGSIPPSGNLPITFTPILGDNITYTVINAAPESFNKSVNKEYGDLGEILTYTITVNNPNNFAINNVLITDNTPVGTTYIGNLIVSEPYTGINLSTGININTIAANSNATISWQVQVENNMNINQIDNIGNVAIPGGTSGNTNIVTTKINHANLISDGNFIKIVDKLFAEPADILTYTLLLKNTGNTASNNVVLTDVIPSGTAYVPNSITSSVAFTGDPLTSVNLTAPILFNEVVTISFKVVVGNTVPSINPIPNIANVKYTYTVNPNMPNGVIATGNSNTVNTLINEATVKTIKTNNKTISYIGDIITYSISVTNTGNVNADNIVITDVLNTGTTYIPGSLTLSVPYTASSASDITLTNPLAPNEKVIISFKVKVTSMPNPNPIINQATTKFTYKVNPNSLQSLDGTSVSNKVNTIIFRNNLKQQINDLIESIANEQAALAAIANAEGAKIQKIISMKDVTEKELLCLNKSVTEMLESINTLESIFKQKISLVECQINGTSCL